MLDGKFKGMYVHGTKLFSGRHCGADPLELRLGAGSSLRSTSSGEMDCMETETTFRTQLKTMDKMISITILRNSKIAKPSPNMQVRPMLALCAFFSNS